MQAAVRGLSAFWAARWFQQEGGIVKSKEAQRGWFCGLGLEFLCMRYENSGAGDFNRVLKKTVL